MKEFKFRVWDKTEKEWLEIKQFGFEEGELWYVQAIDENENDIDPPHFVDSDEIAINQFTGLKDKNGKEIYEGDIYHQGDSKITYTVVWADTGLKGKQNGSNSYAGLEHWKERIEIIGNIYENEDLLK